MSIWCILHLVYHANMSSILGIDSEHWQLVWFNELYKINPLTVSHVAAFYSTCIRSNRITKQYGKLFIEALELAIDRGLNRTKFNELILNMGSFRNCHLIIKLKCSLWFHVIQRHAFSAEVQLIDFLFEF